MRHRCSFVAVLIGLAMLAAPAFAQVPTGTITGTVTYQGQALPGVMVSVNSPAMQGTRTAITAANGDYLFRSLPPGDYTVSFTLDGFKTIDQPVKVTAAQAKTVDAVMYPESVSEEIVVTGAYETISAKTQASTTYEASTIEKLAVPRDLVNAVALAPGVHQTGPSDNITISGAQSYENLFLINGVVVNENLRGQATNLFIEDAIQETTTSTSGVSAEYGRFAGGVVNVLTKSGGNEFSGSFRANLNNESWNGETPLTTSQEDKVNTTYEATLGGFVWRDKIWFFLAGRDNTQTTTLQTVGTSIDIPQGLDETRYEGKLTISPSVNHRIVGSYIKRDRSWTNYFFGNVVDTGDSVYDRSIPEELKAGNYSGVFTENFLVEAQYSTRSLTFVGSGSHLTDLIGGTVIGDDSTGWRGHAATFCGVCKPDETRDNLDYLAKGSYFLTTGNAGSHDIVFGYDHFEDKQRTDNHQSGSDWQFWASEFAFNGQDWAPVVLGGDSEADYFIWWPILYPSQGSKFSVDSMFVNDTWRFDERWSFNIGVRYDKNDGKNSLGGKVSDDSKFSPRLGVSWDPKGDGDWIVNLSYANYVAALANTGNVGNQSPAGSPATFAWFYGGPAINVTEDGPCTPGVDCQTPTQVLQQVFNWFQNDYCDTAGNCGIDNLDTLFFARITGLNRVIAGSLASPYADEWSIGVSKRLGTRGIARTDFVWRDFKDLYETRVDTTTGSVPLIADVLGLNLGNADLGYVENSSYLSRTYLGLTISAQYRLSDRFNLGGNYTWSHAYGNFDGETVGSGPVTSTNNPSYYPEYLDVSWSNPSGDLAIDQRHKLRAWAIWDVVSTSRHNLSLSWLESFSSGTPYGALGAVRSYLYVTNPGYFNRPATVSYYYTPRDAFHTDSVHSTDLALNYSFFLPIAGADVELFIQPEIVNIFNESAVINVDQTVRDRTNSGAYTDFDPFTETPVQGVNWDYASTFGQPQSVTDYQQPRTFRVSLGVRF